MSAPPTDQTVLITGGAGFIGSHLARALSPDNDVRVLDDFSTGSRSNLPADVTILEGDIRDAETCRQAVSETDTVFHLAAQTSVEQSVTHPTKSHAINVTGTLRVLEAARDADARVVVASSAAIYGDPPTAPIDETERVDPQSPYGIEKLAADQYARRYADLYDLSTVVLRYFNVYGPSPGSDQTPGVIDTFLRQATEGGPIIVHGDGAQTRDFVHIDDVVSVTARAATADVSGDAYNIGTGMPTAIRALAERIAVAVDGTPEITHTDSRDGDIRHSRADISKARDQLDFEPTRRVPDAVRALLQRQEKEDAIMSRPDP